jgi:hypothetical protein
MTLVYQLATSGRATERIILCMIIQYDDITHPLSPWVHSQIRICDRKNVGQSSCLTVDWFGPVVLIGRTVSETRWPWRVGRKDGGCDEGDCAGHRRRNVEVAQHNREGIGLINTNIPGTGIITGRLYSLLRHDARLSFVYYLTTSVARLLSIPVGEEGAGRPRSRCSSPHRVKNFSLLLVVQTCCGAHPASYPMGTGVKRPGREADHSPPANAEVKKMWIYTSTLPYAFKV